MSKKLYCTFTFSVLILSLNLNRMHMDKSHFVFIKENTNVEYIICIKPSDRTIATQSELQSHRLRKKLFCNMRVRVNSDYSESAKYVTLHILQSQSGFVHTGESAENPHFFIIIYILTMSICICTSYHTRQDNIDRNVDSEE